MSSTEEQTSELKLITHIMIIYVIALNMMREYDQPAPYFNHIHLSKGDQRCLVAICNEGDDLQKEIHGVDFCSLSQGLTGHWIQM